MLILAYDFETTGLPLFSEPSNDPRQPHIVQVGACLVDADQDYKVMGSVDLIAAPEGWEIPQEAADVHGISTEVAQACGVEESVALGSLLALWQKADVRLGHNEQFDARIARIAIKRYGVEGMADTWKAGQSICTAKLSTPILNLPPTAKMRAAGRNHPKTAKLSEAYEFFTGSPLQNAHSAMADVLGTIEVYRHVLAHQASQGAA